MKIHTDKKGALLVLVLIFGAIFFMLTSGYISYIVMQKKSVDHAFEKSLAREIAETGLGYFKWHLAHYPNDATLGNGTAGPYTYVYNDPELGAIGEYTLDISSTTYCGVVSSIEVTSTGHTYADPSASESIYARYSRPTVASYSYIINSSVWAGPDRVIIGPYHSNGGIRMDGSNNSTVSSGQESWNCTTSFGCPTSQTRDGVFTTTANASTSLFVFPASTINFMGLTVDLALMEDRARNGGGIYIGPSGNYGYRVHINSDNTLTVRRVTDTYQYTGQTVEYGTQNERNIIRSLSSATTYTINPQCPLIFIEDKVWLSSEGAASRVSDKITIAAASASAGLNPSMILNGNVLYDDSDAGLLAVAEQDMLLGVDVPNDMVLNGIYIAQNGRYGRNHYTNTWLPNPSGPLDFRPYFERNSLTLNGTVVSNGRVGEQWTSGGVFSSGFHNRYNSYDRNLVDNPPPLAPHTSDDYRFMEWRELD